MTVESTTRVVEAYLGGHDPSAVSDDAVYTVMDSGYQVHGREAIGQFLNSFYTEVFAASFEQQNLVVSDGHAVLEGFVVGTHNGDFAGIPASGKPVRVPLCVSYDVPKDKIVGARIYLATDALRRQVSEQ